MSGEVYRQSPLDSRSKRRKSFSGNFAANYLGITLGSERKLIVLLAAYPPIGDDLQHSEYHKRFETTAQKFLTESTQPLDLRQAVIPFPCSIFQKLNLGGFTAGRNIGELRSL